MIILCDSLNLNQDVNEYFIKAIQNIGDVLELKGF